MTDEPNIKNDDRLAGGGESRLRELLAKATPGPWFTGHLCVDDHGCNCPYIYSENQHGMGAILTVGTTDEDVANIDEAKANQALVAEAINALPQLLDELAALRQRCEQAEAKATDYWNKMAAAELSAEQAERERNEAVGLLKGCGVLLERLRTAEDRQYTHVEARDGAMVYVSPTIDRIAALAHDAQGGRDG